MQRPIPRMTVNFFLQWQEPMVIGCSQGNPLLAQQLGVQSARPLHLSQPFLYKRFNLAGTFFKML